jgi:CheY-like chemotaxis protein
MNAIIKEGSSRAFWLNHSFGLHLYLLPFNSPFIKKAFIQESMNKLGPIIIIEDDDDDQEMLNQAFLKLNVENEICFFNNGQTALDYLNRTDVIPFLILSDINMPVLDGFALRDKVKMDAKLQVKCIPYLFFTTASNHQVVIDAYSKSVQGFFIKPSSVSLLENTIRVMMEYWTLCASPNKAFEMYNK